MISDHAERTAAAMHRTAERLEVAEAILHRSAEQSPNTETTAQLHALGDQVTTQARDIDRRAYRLISERDPLRQPETAARRRRPRRGRQPTANWPTLKQWTGAALLRINLAGVD
jgi:hypothetical protein